MADYVKCFDPNCWFIMGRFDPGVTPPPHCHIAKPGAHLRLVAPAPEFEPALDAPVDISLHLGNGDNK